MVHVLVHEVLHVVIVILTEHSRVAVVLIVTIVGHSDKRGVRPSVTLDERVKLACVFEARVYGVQLVLLGASDYLGAHLNQVDLGEVVGLLGSSLLSHR